MHFSRQRAVHTAVLLAVAKWRAAERMGRVFVRYVEAETVHCCAQCGTHLAAHEKIVSKAFQVRLLISGESLRWRVWGGAAPSCRSSHQWRESAVESLGWRSTPAVSLLISGESPRERVCGCTALQLSERLIRADAQAASSSATETPLRHHRQASPRTEHSISLH